MGFYNSVLAFVATYKYFAVFILICFAEAGIPIPLPFPSEMVLLFVGYQVYLHKLSFIMAFGVGVMADFTGSFILYLILYHLQDLKLVAKLTGFYTRDKRFIRFKENFDKHSTGFTIIGRLLSYVRFYVTVVVAIIRLPTRQVARYFIIASIIWVFTLIFIGVQLGPVFNNLQYYVTTFGSTVSKIALVITFSLIAFLYFYFTTSKRHD